MITPSSSKFSALLVLCVFLNMSAWAQKPTEIVARYRAALKNTADKDAFKSISAEAVFRMMDIDFPANIVCASPNNMRIEMTLMGKTFIQVNNDSLKWEFNPMTNVHTIKDAENLSSAQSATKRRGFVDYRLLEYDKLNLSLQFKGREKADSIDVFHLELVDKKNDLKISYYINTRTYLVYRAVDDEATSTYLDYENFNGFVLCRRYIEANTSQTMEVNFTRVELNGPIDTKLFIVPDEAKEAVRGSQLSARSELKTAESLYNEGKYAEADRQFTSILEKKPGERDALNGRGLTKIALTDHYAAIADFSAVINLNKDDYVAYNNRGLAKYYLGDNTGARADYDKAILLKPDFEIALKNRGMTFFRTGGFENAAKDFSTVMELNSHDSEAVFKYGVSVAQLGKYEDATHAYDNAFKQGYRTAEYFNYRGVALYHLSRFDSAQVNFAKAVKLDENNAQYNENLGRAWMQQGEHEKALAQFEKCLSMQKDNAELYNLIGLCQYYDENYKAAINQFGRAIELKQDANYYSNRASAKEQLNDFVGALNDYSEFIRISPSDPAVFFKRGMVKIHTSQKLEGCMDLGTAKEMGYAAASEAIMKHCH